MFVVVIMALAATRPVMQLSKQILGKFAAIGKNSPGAWWLSILTLAPILGSFITEPAAMTIAAMLLAEQFYRLKPSSKLAYATIGLLFVNISVGGTLTNFAAPPVLMVKTPWEWTSSFMTLNYGWKALLGIIISNSIYFLAFKKEFSKFASAFEAEAEMGKDLERHEDSIPMWITAVHLLFMGWTVLNAHYPPLFIGGFFILPWFCNGNQSTSKPYQFETTPTGRFFPGGFGNTRWSSGLVDCSCFGLTG